MSDVDYYSVDFDVDSTLRHNLRCIVRCALSGSALNYWISFGESAVFSTMHFDVVVIGEYTFVLQCFATVPIKGSGF